MPIRILNNSVSRRPVNAYSEDENPPACLWNAIFLAFDELVSYMISNSGEICENLLKSVMHSEKSLYILSDEYNRLYSA